MSRGMKGTISIKVLLLIIVMVLPLNLIALQETRIAIETTVEQVKNSEQALADLYMTNLSMRMDNTVSLLYHFVSEDANCMRMTAQPEDDYLYTMSRNKFHHSLRSMAELTNGADGYLYYMNNKKDCLFYNKYKVDKDIINTLEINLSEHDWDKAKEGWHIYQISGLDYLFYQYKLKNLAYGAWISLDSIKADIEANTDLKDIRVECTENPDHQMEKDRIHVSAAAKNTFIHISLSRKEVLTELSLYNRLMFSFALGLLLVIPLLYLILKKLLLKPLHIINDAHREIQQGNPYYRIPEQKTSREFIETFQSFNSMAENLYAYKIDAYEKNIAFQKMELRNLQLQIHPHFLLNCFNLVYNLAQNKKTESVQETILYLSDYFRYIFRNNKDLELFGKELNLIKGYVAMANMRYPGGVMIDYDLDPEIDFVRVPPLLLHNFVDNSIKYGVKEGEVLHISIKGEYKERRVTFYIVDDGNGMDDETLERNREVLTGKVELEDEYAHIGLYNSLKRLKHFYGEDSGIEVETESGSMTAFTIYFSYNVEVDDESFVGE